VGNLPYQKRDPLAVSLRFAAVGANGSRPSRSRLVAGFPRGCRAFYFLISERGAPIRALAAFPTKFAGFVSIAPRSRNRGRRRLGRLSTGPSVRLKT
jgi:hypothetical protein